MYVTLSYRDGTVSGDSGQDENVPACPFPEPRQTSVTQIVRYKPLHTGIGQTLLVLLLGGVAAKVSTFAPLGNSHPSLGCVPP
jgi:hypothetical protein